MYRWRWSRCHLGGGLHSQSVLVSFHLLRSHQGWRLWTYSSCKHLVSIRRISKWLAWCPKYNIRWFYTYIGTKVSYDMLGLANPKEAVCLTYISGGTQCGPFVDPFYATVDKIVWTLNHVWQRQGESSYGWLIGRKVMLQLLVIVISKMQGCDLG